MRRFWLQLRALFGWHNVDDGSTCEISRELFDVHDYPVEKGGDGYPSHFTPYYCHKCGKRFWI